MECKHHDHHMELQSLQAGHPTGLGNNTDALAFYVANVQVAERVDINKAITPAPLISGVAAGLGVGASSAALPSSVLISSTMSPEQTHH